MMIRIHSIKDIPDEIRQVIETFYIHSEKKAQDEAIKLQHAKPEFGAILKDVIKIFKNAPDGISLFYDELVALQSTAEDKLGDSSIPGLSFKDLNKLANHVSQQPFKTENSSSARLNSTPAPSRSAIPMFDEDNDNDFGLKDSILEKALNADKNDLKDRTPAPKFNLLDIFPSDSKVPAAKLSLFDESSVQNTNDKSNPKLNFHNDDAEDLHEEKKELPFSLLNQAPSISSDKETDDDFDLPATPQDIELAEDNAFNLFEDEEENIESKKDNEFKIENDFNLFEDEEENIESKKDNESKIDNDIHLFEDDDKNEIKIENDEIKIENDFNLFEDDNKIEIEIDNDDIKIDNDIHLFEDDDKNENIKIENDEIKIENDFNLFEDDDKNEIKIENDEIKIENDFNLFEDDDKNENIKIENDEIKIENDFNLFEDDDKNEIKIENDFNLFEDEDEKSGNKDFGIKDKNLNAPKLPKIPTLSAQTLGKPASVPTLSAQTLGKPASVPTLSAQTLGKPASVPPPVSQTDMTLQAPDEDEFNLDIDLDFDMDAPSIDLSDMLDEPEAPKSPTPPPISSDALATPAPGMKKDFNIPETQAEPMPNWFNNHNLNKNERHSPSSEGTKPTAEALQPVQEVSAVRGRPGITTESTMSQHPDLNKTPPPPQISKASLLSTNSGLLMPPVGGIGFHKGTTVTETLKPTAVSLPPVSSSDHHDGKPTAISMQAISSTSPNLRDPEREDMALQTLKPFHRIPRLRIPMADLSRRRDINPRAGFILSNIDGITSIRDILDISAFPEPQTALLLVELEEQGIIAFR